MNKRIYGIDLLRIISMFMIVILHILGQGGVLSNLDLFSIKYNLAWLLEITCYCSVNCYALISGFVMFNHKIDYKKLMHLIIDVSSWGIIITFIYSLFFPNDVFLIDYIKSIFNITFNKYWYFSSYFALFLFIPFINKLIENLDHKTYKKLIITIILLMCFMSLEKDPFNIRAGYSFIWLLCLYFIGAYIRKFNINYKFKNRKLFLFFSIISAVLITFTSKILFISYGINNHDMLINYNSFTILFISIAMLILFANLNIKNKILRKIIIKFSNVTFGVYIIHCHSIIWNKLLKNAFVFLINYSMIEMIYYVLYYGFVIYFLCSVLEILRKFVFKKLKIYYLFDNLYNYFIECLQLLKLI